LHKEPGLEAQFELLSTTVSVLEMRWQHVPSLDCNDKINYSNNVEITEYKLLQYSSMINIVYK